MESKKLTAEEYERTMEAAQRFAQIEQCLLVATEEEEGDKFLPSDEKGFLEERMGHAYDLIETHGKDPEVKAAIGLVRDALAFVADALKAAGDQEADRWEAGDDYDLMEAVSGGSYLPAAVTPEYYAGVLSTHCSDTRLDLIRGLPDVLEPLVRKYNLPM